MLNVSLWIMYNKLRYGYYLCCNLTVNHMYQGGSFCPPGRAKRTSQGGQEEPICCLLVKVTKCCQLTKTLLLRSSFAYTRTSCQHSVVLDLVFRLSFSSVLIMSASLFTNYMYKLFTENSC